MMYENFRHTHGSGSGAGPIEGSARNTGSVIPVSKNGNLDSAAPSKSERLNSPNTSSWAPDVRMLLSTAQWLKIHGLKRHKLDMGQILPSIGFRHSDDYVRPLKKPVRARYCKGLFTQVPFRDGTVYNLVASKEKLRMIESQLTQAITLYKRRLEWLTTERCAMDSDCWQEHAVNVTLDSMEGALNWIWDLKTTVPRSATCTVEGILKALADQHVEAVYLFTEGIASDGSQEMLRRKVDGCRVPIHVVSLNCNAPATITFLKDISRMTKGRFHAYSIANEYEDSFDSFTKSMEVVDSASQPQGRGRGDGMPSLKLGVGVREDVIALWEELDEARNTLAEIQALLCEIKDPKETPKTWFEGQKLVFYDLLQTLAFKHCDGVVDIQMAPAASDSSDAIVRPKLVNARYCDKFAHVRWKDGSIMHVHVSGPIHRNYEQRILSALDSYRKRMEWLQQGSRELFGTIIEDQVAVLIDTSASMASRLFLVKDKLYRLMQEQLRHKLKFNLVKYDTRVQAWRDRLVDCNTHNLDNAWQWVKGLSTGGSTNTLAALKLALADPQCHAIYLLTDGRPDQPPSSILAQVQLLSPVPIHAISFNCADTEANQFLCQLAAETGGRFHYFSEDGYDIDGPRPFESEDLRLLREEIEKGLADLRKVTMIRNECAQLDWFGSNTGRCSKSHPRSASASSHRPISAKHTMTPSPPGSERSASARVHPATARPRPASARPRPASARLTYSSHKDYIVSNACRDIPQSPSQASRNHKVGETRTSQMRLNLRKKTADSWMLDETRQYVAKKPEDFKQRQPKRKSKKKNGSSSRDDQKWLKKHGLAARRLTILDALAPTVIPHTTKYVPILDKHVLSKVFDQVLPLAHTSGSNRDEVQLVNPQGVNLKAYEARLETAIEDYTRRLNELVFVSLSDEERMK
ncbi:Von Willebrand factor A [Desmophyllum pertusum]|uniref:von Willebrand factor A n=1 Tax=Desmophyllum pertusum TaxID=174260 RepID=A0A9X0CN54_9CNID|nr:Von Willebrand factor A [Desmophyllum pertusum]